MEQEILNVKCKHLKDLYYQFDCHLDTSIECDIITELYVDDCKSLSKPKPNKEQERIRTDCESYLNLLKPYSSSSHYKNINKNCNSSN